MSLKTTLSISEARKKIFDIAKDVQKPGKYYILTEKGASKAVVMSVDEFESWQETLEVMQDFPNLKAEAKEAEEQYKKGEYVNLQELLAEDAKKDQEHALSSTSVKKSYKRNRKN